jgi:hypothetical protein
VRGSTAAIVNMGARAEVGQTSFVLAVVLGVPSIMGFDWLFWWAGRRRGDRVFFWLLGGDDARAAPAGPRALAGAPLRPGRGDPRGHPADPGAARVRRRRRRRDAAVAVPCSRPHRHAAVDDAAGHARYQLGQGAVDVVDAIGRYSLWATIALVIGVVVFQVARAHRRLRRGVDR